jgi:hypothetical protein
MSSFVKTFRDKNFNLFEFLRAGANERILNSEKELKFMVTKMLEENCEERNQAITFFKNQILGQNIFEFLNLLKNFIKNNISLSRTNIDLIFSFIIIGISLLSQEQIYVKQINYMENILFSLAMIYSELSEFRKCLIVIKKFLMLENENLKISNCLNKFCSFMDTFETTCSEFHRFLKGLETNTCLTFIQNEIKISLFDLVDMKSILQNEFKTNFLILMLNSLISISGSENRSVIYVTYHFLHEQHINIISANSNSILSQRHFNNITKVLCKMNEILLKTNSKEFSKENKNDLIYSNLIKILMYEFLFSSKNTDLGVTLVFITNHINELIILQNSAMKEIEF